MVVSVQAVMGKIARIHTGLAVVAWSVTTTWIYHKLKKKLQIHEGTDHQQHRLLQRPLQGLRLPQQDEQPRPQGLQIEFPQQPLHHMWAQVDKFDSHA